MPVRVGNRARGDFAHADRRARLPTLQSRRKNKEPARGPALVASDRIRPAFALAGYGAASTSEAEVELAHHLGGVEADLVGHRDAADGAADGLVAVEAPAPFDADADVVPDRILDAAAHRAAGHRVVVGGGA